MSKHFPLGPREHGELPFPFVLYSAIHRPFLSACSANRPSSDRTSFLGRFSAGTRDIRHAPRRRWRSSGGGFRSHTCKTDSSGISDMFPSAAAALLFVYDSCTHSDFLADYHVLFRVSNGLIKAFPRQSSLHRRPWCVGITILFA